VVGVASERDTLVLELSGHAPSQGDGVAPGGDLLSFLDEHGVTGKQLHQMREGLTLIVPRDNLPEERRIRQELSQTFGAALRVSDDLGAVSVVGGGITATFGNLLRGREALAVAGIHAHGVATSSFRITWMVDRSRLDDAVRTLHARLVAPGDVA
jgi:aspartate kinase